MLDLAIRGGQVVDGTGWPRRSADVGIRDGRVVAIGRVDDLAARTIEADGAIVAPGFIDVHTHYDAQVMWDPALTPSSLHGVTTVIGGNCGFSVAPLSADSADFLMRMLARVEGMPLSALERALTWDWRSTADYLDRLEGSVALNTGFMVGHSAIRRVVMGPAASQRPGTPDELQEMKRLLREGLAAGGLGFSSSLAQSHSDASGEPVPSRHASYDELLELAGVCGEFDGTSLELVPHAGAEFPEPVKALMVDLSVRADRPLNWNLLNPRASNSEEIERKLEVGDRAAAAGGRVVGLVMPLPILTRLNFESGFVLDMLPGWDKPMALATTDKQRMLSNQEERTRLRHLAGQDHPMKMIARWDDYLFHECFTDATRSYQGRRVGDIAEEEKRDAFDVLVEVALADGLRTSFGRPPVPDTEADWEARRRVLADSRALVGASDAGAHLDMINTFSYTTQLLEKAVREQRILELEQAIHMLTQAPAELYGIKDRGVLREGSWADVVVFDEGRVGCGPLHTRRDLPGGAGRLFAESTGIDRVLVNGMEVVVRGQATSDLPGRVLRSGRDTTSL
jgi:N-acyl-D-aspartate/D-glutamate deacylase